MNATRSRTHCRDARNRRRAELSSSLAGVAVDRATSGGTDPRPALRRRFYIPALLSLAVATMLAAVNAAAAAQAGELRPEVDEVLRLTPDRARGAEIFAYCAGCHASPTNGLPQGWVPDISGQHPSYLAKQLVEYRHGVRWGAHMESVAKGHVLYGLQDVADVVAFVSGQSADWNRPASGGAVSAEARGRYRAKCGSCHGGAGEGNNRQSVPRIGGLNIAYVLRQLHDVVDGRRPNLEVPHLALLQDLDVQQLLGLSGYISHLGAGSGPPGVTQVPNPSLVHDPAAPGGR